jgi:Mor family transcriptional regulator
MLAEILELRGDAAFHRRRTPNLPQNLRLIEPREVAVGDWVDIRGTYRPCDLSTCFDTSVLAQADDNYPGRLWEVVEVTERSVALQLEGCQARRLRKQLKQVWRPYLSIAMETFAPSLPVETRTLDALGRGRGDGRRGGVRAVQLTRKLKRAGKVATYTQWRLQWEEPRGGKPYSATRNLRKAIASDVRRDWEAGMTAKEICKKYNLEKPKHG